MHGRAFFLPAKCPGCRNTFFFSCTSTAVPSGACLTLTPESSEHCSVSWSVWLSRKEERSMHSVAAKSLTRNALARKNQFNSDLCACPVISILWLAALSPQFANRQFVLYWLRMTHTRINSKQRLPFKYPIRQYAVFRAEPRHLNMPKISWLQLNSSDFCRATR